MQLQDLLNLLQDEFLQDAQSTAAAVSAWQRDPDSGAEHAATLLDAFERLERGADVLGMEGLIAYLHKLSEFVQVAQFGADTEALHWLTQWQAPVQSFLKQPGSAVATGLITDHLRACPLGCEPEALSALAAMLSKPLAMPVDDLQSEAEALRPADADDVSLSVDDVDAGLLSALLSDAPEQLDKLADIVAAMVQGARDAAPMQEAQRITHTLKGSGNIVGLPGLARLSHRLEDLMEYTLEQVQNGHAPSVPMARDMAVAVSTLQQMVSYLLGEDAAPEDAHSIGALQKLLDWLKAIREGTVDEQQMQAAAPAVHSGFAAAVRSEVPLVVLDSASVTSDTAAQAVSLAAVPVVAPVSDPMPVAAAPVAAAAPWAAPSIAPASPAAAPAPAAEAATLRVGLDRMTRVVRRAGQSMVGLQRLNLLMSEASNKLVEVDHKHLNLGARLRELEATVSKQIVDRQAQGDQLDSLEMDRYDAIYTLARFITEAVQDEVELAREARAKTEQAMAILRDETYAQRDQHRELLDARLVPVKTVLPRLKRNVTQTAQMSGKQCMLRVEGEQVTMDTDVLARLTEPLLHMLRNAVDHGIESPEERSLLGKPEQGVITLSFTRAGSEIRLVCKDDGHGMDLPAIRYKAQEYGLIARDAVLSDDDVRRLVLRAGFSTRDTVTEVSGRGVGMDIVNDRVTALKGRIDIASESGVGTTFTLHVPVSTGSLQALVVECGGEKLALPSDQIATIVMGASPTTNPADPSAQIFQMGGTVYPYFELAQWAGLAASEKHATALARPTIIMHGVQGSVALGVDAVLETRELVLQDVGRLLRRLPGVTSGALRPDGRPLLVLDLQALERASRSGIQRGSGALLRSRMAAKRTRALVVDDALSVRKSMEQLLQDAGYEVMLAVDGFDALEQIKRSVPNIVVTDLEMPNLNGLDFTRRVRAQESLGALGQRLPVVMITSRATDKHRDLATQAGVDLYLTKPFQDVELLGQVRRLVAAAALAAPVSA